MKSIHKQKGAETVEFAMIALLFFALLFAVIEFSRALFVWNALTEATRRGARMAVICPYQSSIPKQVAIFDVIAGSLGTSPIVAGLTPDMVNVRYLNEAGSVEADQTLIKFAEVTITGYVHTLLIPLWGSSFSAPEFKTTLPTESLGVVPTYQGDPPIAPRCDF
jgi:Flp pilus assembly protein TadG